MPFAILLHADKSWHQNSAHLPFGATYHTWFPALGHNKSSVQTSTLLFWNSHLYSQLHPQTIFNQASHALQHMHILLPFDIIQTLIFNLVPLNYDTIVHE
jgi:hypothetical protein